MSEVCQQLSVVPQIRGHLFHEPTQDLGKVLFHDRLVHFTSSRGIWKNLREGKEVYHSVFQHMSMVNREPEVRIHLTSMVILIIHTVVTLDRIRPLGNYANFIQSSRPNPIPANRSSNSLIACVSCHGCIRARVA